MPRISLIPIESMQGQVVVGLMNFTNKVHEALALPLEEKFLH